MLAVITSRTVSLCRKLKMGNIGGQLFCSTAPEVASKMFLDKYDDSNASVMLKIVVMGRVGVGKSAITSRFAHGVYPGRRYTPTTVANFAMKSLYVLRNIHNLGT